MEFRTPVHIEPLLPAIDHGRKGLLVGSCFAEHIGQRMQRAKLPVMLNPFGIQFNPASIAATLERLHSGEPFTREELLPCGELWVSLRHHGSFSSSDPNQTLERINGAAAAGRAALADADYLILTLGTTWVYEYAASGEIVSNCHKLPPSAFRRRRMSVQEIISELESALHPYLINNKQVILTVSPVRHAGDGLQENQLSKSTLVVAAAELAGKHPGVSYFPAYEIVMDELRDYRFYQADMMHPSETAVDYIWERFCETALSPLARELAAHSGKLREAMEHRPLNPNSDTHRSFRARMRTDAQALQTRHPEVDFSPEIAYFTD